EGPAVQPREYRSRGGHVGGMGREGEGGAFGSRVDGGSGAGEVLWGMKIPPFKGVLVSSACLMSLPYPPPFSLSSCCRKIPSGCVNRPGMRLTLYKTVNVLARCSETNTSRWSAFGDSPEP